MSKLLETNHWTPSRLAAVLARSFTSYTSRIVLLILLAQLVITCVGCGGDQVFHHHGYTDGYL